MEADDNAQEHHSPDDGSTDAQDGGDALRALVDQFEAAERELRATEELRRVHAEQVARLREEVIASVDASLGACAAEREELDGRLHALDEREGHLRGIKARMTGEPAPDTTPSGDTTASSTQAVPPVNDGWVTSDPKDRDTPNDTGEQHASEEGSGADAAQAPEGSAEGTPEGDRTPGPEGEDGAAYEDGWYEVLKQRR